MNEIVSNKIEKMTIISLNADLIRYKTSKIIYFETSDKVVRKLSFLSHALHVISNIFHLIFSVLVENEHLEAFSSL